MGFCTQCGNSIEATSRFCGKCGSEIKRQEPNQSLQAENKQSTNSSGSRLQDPMHGQNTPKRKYDKKAIGIILAISICLIIYLGSPKKLTEQEYQDLAIEILVKDKLAMDNFSDAIDYSGIYMGLEPEWSEEYKQLIEPAKNLEKDFEDLSDRLEKVKPPEYFVYEHENLLKVLNAHKNMASNIGSYLIAGDEEYMELFEEYENTADEYLDESIFANEKYEEQVMETYRKMTID
ncbi:zinc-ribbon domain-containing protein [Planomicrobium sp. CPCC 101110]|uniref:zinc-ribbon domain-containing protein n=1 Tax=Planomicrobium sp. CPCC 101110 TaxID=2599619 RepID=UPI0011B6ED9A|nr:zinc ribbon domain-containing protein [Planomicrobium sp. CPCC 101110]TWT27733.1 zinc-ribbon domain-containing protein [Planomicrobium sp. CPCC 101110]